LNVGQRRTRHGDDGPGRNVGGGGVGRGAFSGQEPAGCLPAIVGEVDLRAGLDAFQKHEGEGVRIVGIVIDDGKIAGGKGCGHGLFLALAAASADTEGMRLANTRLADTTLFWVNVAAKSYSFVGKPAKI
jgi:hypothetical protein